VADVREELVWRKAPCGNSACIEVAFDQREEQQATLIRDSEDPAGRWLVFAPQDWTAFLSAVREGRF
jgi:hypothetical protein